MKCCYLCTCARRRLFPPLSPLRARLNCTQARTRCRSRHLSGCCATQTTPRPEATRCVFGRNSVSRHRLVLAVTLRSVYSGGLVSLLIAQVQSKNLRPNSSTQKIARFKTSLGGLHYNFGRTGGLELWWSHSTHTRCPANFCLLSSTASCTAITRSAAQ